MKCEICNKEFNMLGKHIRHHNISSEKYYLKYIGDKGYCETCGKPTRFYTLDKGYERLNVDNGITLCTNCHRYVHSKYVMCVQ